MQLRIPLLSQGLKLPNSKQDWRVSGFHFLWNRYHQWLSDIELNQTVLFSTSYSRNNTWFTNGKRIGVWNCHATCGHRKTNILTSIVSGFCMCISCVHSIMHHSWSRVALENLTSWEQFSDMNWTTFRGCVIISRYQEEKKIDSCESKVPFVELLDFLQLKLILRYPFLHNRRRSNLTLRQLRPASSKTVTRWRDFCQMHEQRCHT